MILVFNIRVSKYNPKLRDKAGKFIGSDWTSISDIDEKIFTVEEYLNVENEYVCYVEDIVKNNKIKNLVITEFEDVGISEHIPEILLKETTDYCRKIKKRE
jgi:hypothetical protein